jgi:hypothetical protein
VRELDIGEAAVRVLRRDVRGCVFEAVITQSYPSQLSIGRIGAEGGNTSARIVLRYREAEPKKPPR